MKKLLLIGIVILGLQFNSIFAEESKDMFSELENTVGFIKTQKGEKYLVIETKSGAKLVKTEKDPEQVIQRKIGISKEDLNFQ